MWLITGTKANNLLLRIIAILFYSIKVSLVSLPSVGKDCDDQITKMESIQMSLTCLGFPEEESWDDSGQ